MAAAPLPHRPGKPPAGVRVPVARTGSPLAHAPAKARVTRVPAQRPVAKVPNPKLPKLVRDVHGGDLMDMFEIFPDLPRPPRADARVQVRRTRTRALRRR